MTPLQQEPSAHAPWISTMLGKPAMATLLPTTSSTPGRTGALSLCQCRPAGRRGTSHVRAICSGEFCRPSIDAAIRIARSCDAGDRGSVSSSMTMTTPHNDSTHPKTNAAFRPAAGRLALLALITVFALTPLSVADAHGRDDGPKPT